MKEHKKYTVALVLAFMIIASSIFNIFSPGVKLREAVEVFFSKQMDVLAAMGGDIYEEGIPSAVLEAFKSLQKDRVNMES